MLAGRISRHRALELWRYYQAGIANTAFGFGCYALLVALGLNRYAAQLTAHVLGVVFNYLTYTHHVFRAAAPAKLRFAASYVVNYFLGLAGLYLVSRVVADAILAGFVATLLVSIVNYFMLRRFVYRRGG